MSVSADADLWLAACKEAAVGASAAIDAAKREGTLLDETGDVGAGGDRTLRIDALAEEAVFAALLALSARGASFTVVSEERGCVAYGDGGPVRVAVDPIDGSLNAKREAGRATMSIAISGGPTVADVEVAFVWDFERCEAFHAVRGHGAFLDGTPLFGPERERRVADGRLELLCIETSDARLTAQFGARLADVAYRWRILGSIACALCQVATPRVDAMVNVSECRVIDAAAAALIVRESGGTVLFSGGDDLPLELASRTTVAAARTVDAASQLLELLA